DQLPIADKAQRKRRATVRAKVLQHGDVAVLAPEQHHFFIADRAAKRLSREFVRRAGHIPSVFQKHSDSLPGARARQGSVTYESGLGQAGRPARRIRLPPSTCDIACWFCMAILRLRLAMR